MIRLFKHYVPHAVLLLGVIDLLLLVANNLAWVQRMAFARARMGDEIGARRLLANYIALNPREGAASAMLARMQRAAGNPARAALLFRHATASGSGPADPLLLAELSEMEALIGNTETALGSAGQAHSMQRGNQRVARVMAVTMEMAGHEAGGADVLMAKARGAGMSANLASR